MEKRLIALVTVHVLVDGRRQVIEPGQDLPELAVHDERELLASGAIEDSARTEADQKRQAQADKKATEEFRAARKRVQAETESIAATAPTPPTTP